ncbi:DUF4349 domain-containing protein [Sphingomonas sp. LB-2]|uniref:DUF4349 domain-containing protein n=1 Tax=Sphingomonas caeni TaxID=2984949 RepID=UPI0022320774|nr:DUF4349 domain-containing protein [Sphingomonas caeni]MCW3848190.1 DUF4349 domain-containing protein [Sphingomonas caeni]
MLAGCGSVQQTGDSQSTSAAEIASADASAPGEAKTGAPGAAEPVKVTLPQLSYSYKLTYLLPGDKVAEVQEAHRTLCEQMGPARCQILSLQRGTGENTHAEATLQLRVASNEARAFTDSMGKSVTNAGGRNTESTIATEEVSKAIVDTRARIEQRELLVKRLTEVLRNKSGSVEELVEAERSVTQAQEELDQARAWLTELQGRVAMANVDISYGSIAASADAGSVTGQLGDATLGSATSFMIGVRALLTVFIYLAPWGLLALLGFLGIRRLSRRRAAPPAPLGDG